MIVVAKKTRTRYLISRTRHDYVSTEEGSIDGGQDSGYYRSGGAGEIVYIDIPDIKLSDLYNDWNRREDKYNIIDFARADKIGIQEIDEYLFPDKDSLEWKKASYVWGTNGPDGDQPTKFINLCDASTDHLENILKLSHITPEYRKVIESILSDREK